MGQNAKLNEPVDVSQITLGLETEGCLWTEALSSMKPYLEIEQKLVTCLPVLLCCETLSLKCTTLQQACGG